MLNKNKKVNLLKDKIINLKSENETISNTNLKENDELKNINDSKSEEIDHLQSSKNLMEEKYNNLYNE